MEVAHPVAKILVEIRDSLRGLVHDDDRPAMAREPLGCAHLVVPRKPTLRILPKINVVRWVSIDEIRSLERDLLEFADREAQPDNTAL